MKIAIIGGGAAGFFAAINCASEFLSHQVIIFEKSNKILSKVRISGGGRCNVTHACFENDKLIEFYPRGKKELRNAFARFNTINTVDWFESRGVKLKTESDGRMFPVTDNSETIINCLLTAAEKNHVKLNLNYSLENISYDGNGKFNLFFQNQIQLEFDKVIITTGGSQNKNNYKAIEQCGHNIISPVPSLFTFNIQNSPLKGLEGVSVQNALVQLEGAKYSSMGPVLITHWGLSGPSILRMSSVAARWLHEKEYDATCIINWCAGKKEEEIREEIIRLKINQSLKKVYGVSFQGLPTRLWQRLCYLSGIQPENICSELNKSVINKLTHNCCRFQMIIKGKTTFKDEFVTCGGVSLKDVNMQTMESKKIKGIYFAGEVLDIDGVTGGFNFQSAWTTGYLAGINAGINNTP